MRTKMLQEGNSRRKIGAGKTSPCPRDSRTSTLEWAAHTFPGQGRNSHFQLARARHRPTAMHGMSARFARIIPNDKIQHTTRHVMMLKIGMQRAAR